MGGVGAMGGMEERRGGEGGKADGSLETVVQQKERKNRK